MNGGKLLAAGRLQDPNEVHGRVSTPQSLHNGLFVPDIGLNERYLTDRSERLQREREIRTAHGDFDAASRSRQRLNRVAAHKA